MSEAKFTTTNKEFIHVKRDALVEERQNDETYGRYLRFGEEVFWDSDFY